ncbi:MAG TPA: flagellar basal body rod protein FlgC [Longimicrobiales bacterium]|nr:flagellar basal body rod protein FlgC [Longimicrobiales bacterium]
MRIGEGGVPLPTERIREPLRGLGIAASGLSAQRARLDAIAANIANAETTRGVDGTPYRRKVVRLEEVAFESLLPGTGAAAGEGEGGGVRVAGVEEDATEGALRYDPGHPDADAAGYVRMPNVDISSEMVDLMSTRRLFDANATVFQAMKSILRRATQI